MYSEISGPKSGLRDTACKMSLKSEAIGTNRPSNKTSVSPSEFDPYY